MVVLIQIILEGIPLVWVSINYCVFKVYQSKLFVICFARQINLHCFDSLTGLKVPSRKYEMTIFDEWTTETFIFCRKYLTWSSIRVYQLIGLCELRVKQGCTTTITRTLLHLKSRCENG